MGENDSNIRELREALGKIDWSLNMFAKMLPFITKLLESNMHQNMAFGTIIQFTQKITAKRKIKTVNTWYILGSN